MSTKLIYTSTYTFTPAANVTIKPIIYKLDKITNVPWPLTEIKGINRTIYRLQSPFELIIPKKAEYIQVYLNPKVSAIGTVIRSNNNVVWFDNSTNSNLMATLVHVTFDNSGTSSVEENKDTTDVKYLLYADTSNDTETEPYLFLRYGTAINALGNTSNNVIEDAM